MSTIAPAQTLGADLAAKGYTKFVPDLFDTQVLLMAETIDFTGKRTLELGARDGRHSVAALELGAKFAVAMDGRSEEFGKDSRVNYIESDVTTCPFVPGYYDIVMAYGLLYHMADPIDLLKKITETAQEWLVISTHCVTGWAARDQCQGYFGQIRAEGCSDIDALQAGTSFWLEETELIRAIRDLGWEVVKKFNYEISGLPAVWLAARPKE